MVLTSRFISCSRKSSLRPQGSGLSASVSQWARCPRRRVTSSDTSDRAGHAHHLLRHERLVGRRLQAQLAHALEQPGFHAGAPLLGGGAEALGQIAEPLTRRLQVGRAGDRPRAIASRPSRAAPATARPRPRRPTSAAASASSSTLRSRTTRACGIRSRSPGLSGPDTRPVARAASRADASAAVNSAFNSTVGAGGVRSCTETFTSTRPRETCCWTSCRTRGSSSASICDSRTCRSRKRWLTVFTLTAIVACSFS